MDALTAALEALVGAKAAAKFVAFLGAVFIAFGWLRSRGGRSLGRAIVALSDEEREEPRQITRGEFHDLRNALHGIRWKMDQFKREFKKDLDEMDDRLAALEERK